MPSPTTSVVPVQPANYGALINLITGIQGVAPGGQASINMPVNARIHRLNFQCSGISYGIGGTAVAVTPTVAGTETFSAAVTNGVITTINITSAATAKADGSYNLTITGGNFTTVDGQVYAMGGGASATYTVAGGLVTAVQILSGGTPSPIPPELFFTSQFHKVNGIIMRDINAIDTVRIAFANSLPMFPGSFPVLFTEPWRRIVDHDQATAWDLQGQKTYQILFGIMGGITSPQLDGTYEFDYLRNARRSADGKTDIIFLRPIKQHTFTFNVPAGVYNVTQLPVDFPIQRLWMKETGPGSIQRVELYQDGNKIVEGTIDQYNQMLVEYGFTANAYDYPVVFDPDQRLGKALKVNNLILRVYSAAPTALNITMEIQQDDYV